MTGRYARWSFLLLAVLGLGTLVPAAELGARSSALHITMDGSLPADGETVVGDVTEIRLFFSGAPLLRGASVRIVTSSRELMRSTPPAADPEDSKQLFTRIEPALPPGAYVVQWRCIADDGHVMRGDFRFEVAPE